MLIRCTPLLFCLAMPVAALAGGADDLAEGLRYFSAMDYDAAMPKLAAAKTDSALDGASRARAAIHLAIIQLSLGDEASARRNFGEALELDRSATVPAGSSPRVKELLQEARAALPPEAMAAVAMRHTPPATGSMPATVVIELDPPDGPGVARVMLYSRGVGSPTWAEGPMATGGGGRYEAVLTPASEDAAVQYYVVAQSSDGSAVAQAGSAALPLQFQAGAAVSGGAAGPDTPSAVVDSPFYTRWWFWTAVGVVVVGGAAAAYLLTRDGGECGGSGEGCIEVGFRE